MSLEASDTWEIGTGPGDQRTDPVGAARYEAFPDASTLKVPVTEA